LVLIAGAGFAGLMYADPVFRIRARRWSWDKWVWLRDDVLTSRVYAGYDEPMRYAGVTMCLVFLIGLATVPFAPTLVPRAFA